MRKQGFLIVLLIGLGSAALAAAQTESIVIQPDGRSGKDIYVCGCAPYTPFNSKKTTFNQGMFPDCEMRAFLQFELSDIPEGVEIVSATMELYCTQAPVRPSGEMLFRRNSGDWSVSRVTYGNQPNAEELDEIACPWPGETGWVAVDITAFARGWYQEEFPNCGMVGLCHNVEPRQECFASYNTSDTSYNAERSPENRRPKLTITFSQPVTGVSGWDDIE